VNRARQSIPSFFADLLWTVQGGRWRRRNLHHVWAFKKLPRQFSDRPQRRIFLGICLPWSAVGLRRHSLIRQFHNAVEARELKGRWCGPRTTFLILGSSRKSDSRSHVDRPLTASIIIDRKPVSPTLYVNSLHFSLQDRAKGGTSSSTCQCQD
jgi:hypothetical protein